MAESRKERSPSRGGDSGRGSDIITPDEKPESARKSWSSPPSHKRDGHKPLWNSFFAKINGSLVQENFTQYSSKGGTKNLHHHLGRPDKPSKNQTEQIADEPQEESVQAWLRCTKNNFFMWSSKTLPWEIALSVNMGTDIFQAVRTMILIATTDKDPGLFLFVVYDSFKNVPLEGVKEVTVRTARLLRRSLGTLVPGHLPYILPCVFSDQGLSEEAITQAVSKGWNNTLDPSPCGKGTSNARAWAGQGPTSLKPDQLEKIRNSVHKLVSLSEVPACLDHTNKGKMYEMDPAHTDAVVCFVRYLLDVSDMKPTILYDLDNEKVKCAILEAAKRVAHQKKVRIMSTDAVIMDAVRFCNKSSGCDLDIYNDENSQDAIVLNMGRTHPSSALHSQVFDFRKANEPAGELSGPARGSERRRTGGRRGRIVKGPFNTTSATQ